MTRFRYEAFSSTGAIAKGAVEAITVTEAISLISGKNLRPYLVEPEVRLVHSSNFKISFGKPNLEWRAKFVRQLATLLAAGITLDRSLYLMVQQATRKSEKIATDAISQGVTSGLALSSAISKSSDLFQPDEIGLIKAGEQTGSPVAVLEELASLMERRIDLRGKLASAMVYPAFLLALAPISLIIIATVLVPNLAPLFEGSGADMPLALRAMIWFSIEFRDRGIMWLVFLALFIVAVFWFLRLEKVSTLWSEHSTRLPFVGVLKRKTESARICRTLGSLIRSGAPLQNALQAIVAATASRFTQTKLQEVSDAVVAGAKLGDALKIIPAIDKTSLQMIAIGEETNKLDSMLLYIAASEEQAVAQYVDRMMTLLTPLLTIALGLFVGGMVMSIMQAILSVNELVGK
jgi:general secretion pathway protein F